MTTPKVRNKVNPGVKITLDKERTLKFDLNAMVTFEEATGKSLSDGAFTNVVRVNSRMIGVDDDKTTEFSLDNIPIEGTLKLYIDHVLQVKDIDYVVNIATIIFTQVPQSKAEITADYAFLVTMSPRSIRTMLWACLLHEDETLTEKQVGSWVDVSNILEITTRLIEAYTVAMPEKEDKQKAPLVKKSQRG